MNETTRRMHSYMAKVPLTYGNSSSQNRRSADIPESAKKYRSRHQHEPNAQNASNVTNFDAWCKEVQLASHCDSMEANCHPSQMLSPSAEQEKTNADCENFITKPGAHVVSQNLRPKFSENSLIGEPGPALQLIPSYPKPRANIDHRLTEVNPYEVALALTKTMLGDWLYKDSHIPNFWDSRNFKGFLSSPPSHENLKASGVAGTGTPQRRWVWLAPVEKQIMWQRNSVLPGSSAFRGEENSIRKVPIIAAFEANASSHDLELNCGSIHAPPQRKRALFIVGPRRMIRLTAPDSTTHQRWLVALQYVAAASNNGISATDWRKAIQSQLALVQPISRQPITIRPKQVRVNSNPLLPAKIFSQNKTTDNARLRTQPKAKKETLRASQKSLPPAPQLSPAASMTALKNETSPMPANVRRRRTPSTPVKSKANEASTVIEGTIPWSTPKTPRHLRKSKQRRASDQNNTSLGAGDDGESHTSEHRIKASAFSSPSIAGRVDDELITNKLSSGAVSSSSGNCTQITGLDDHLLVFEQIFRAGASRPQSRMRSSPERVRRHHRASGSSVKGKELDRE